MIEKKMNIIEEESMYDEEFTPVIHEPFDPKDVDIITQSMAISNIIDRLKYDEIILTPDFQRSPDLWDDEEQSRLIESLIIKIPLPSFYFDYTDDDKLIVVDGQQRLYTIKRFAVLDREDKKKLKLTGLEYLSEYEGKYYEELPISIQRRIREQTITAYVIRTGTPDKVRTSIFNRINTGGLTLTRSEIRNSVYRGKAADLLRELAHSDEFVRATRKKIDPIRMMDCEFVNRTLAFWLLGLERYQEDYDDFLDEVMRFLQKLPDNEILEIKKGFLKAMKYSNEIFSKDAFRKLNKNGNYGKINKPLYECVSVQLALLNSTDCQTLVERKDIFLKKYKELQMNKEFATSISSGTGKRESAKKRHEYMRRIIMEVISSD